MEIAMWFYSFGKHSPIANLTRNTFYCVPDGKTSIDLWSIEVSLNPSTEKVDKIKSVLIESNSSTKEKICNATNNENSPKRTLKCHWVARKSTKHRSKRRIGQLQKKSGMSANNGEIKAHTYTHAGYTRKNA